MYDADESHAVNILAGPLNIVWWTGGKVGVVKICIEGGSKLRMCIIILKMFKLVR